MGDLLTKQLLFTRRLLQLFDWSFNHGYEISLGEAWRSDETAELDEKKGLGISQSLHRVRLAIDLNLFRNGEFLRELSDYRPAGIYWESLSDIGNEFCWGGRWGDADHFSLGYHNVK